MESCVFGLFYVDLFIWLVLLINCSFLGVVVLFGGWCVVRVLVWCWVFFMFWVFGCLKLDEFWLVFLLVVFGVVCWCWCLISFLLVLLEYGLREWYFLNG